MSRPSKYKTPQEKKEALKIYAKNWYERHKNDPEFIKVKKFRYNKYKKGLKETKEQFLREYNTDYIFYIRNVRTGKFQKKIVKAEQTSEQLIKSIKDMKMELDRLLNKFEHLENKENKETNDK